MLLKPADVAYLSDFELLKTILCSADRFPGLYRFDPDYGGLMNHEQFLKLVDLMEVGVLSLRGMRWSRDQWFEAHRQVHALSFGPGGRNSQRKSESVRSYIEELYNEWAAKPLHYSLCAVDNQRRVTAIEEGKTYYLMGSLLRFEKSQVLISYDAQMDEAALTLQVPFQAARKYIEEVFSAESVSQLFWRAEVLALLHFDEGPGQFVCNDLVYQKAFAEMDPGAPVLAAQITRPLLPIRFSKFMGVTRVNRRFA